MSTVSAPSSIRPSRHRWTQDEFQQLIETGLFPDRRVELVDGEVLEMPPPDEPHYQALRRLVRAMSAVFGVGYSLRPQAPFIVEGDSRIEPDLAVVRGDDSAFRSPPTTAVLIAEVSQSSLAYDRGEKGGLYARAGVPDYWVLNLAERRLEVYRKPVADPSQRLGYRYDELRTYACDGQVAPLSADKSIRVADLFV